MPPVRTLDRSSLTPKLQVKVPHSDHTFELMMVVAQMSNYVSARYGLSFLDKDFPDVSVQRNQGFSVLVVAVIDDDGRTPAFVDVCFHYQAIGDGDYRLSGRSGDVDTLMNCVSAFPVRTHPAMKVGDDPDRRACTCRVHDIPSGTGVGSLQSGRTCRQSHRHADGRHKSQDRTTWRCPDSHCHPPSCDSVSHGCSG